MGKATITVLDAVHCRANKYARHKIKRCLRYETTQWKKSRFGGRHSEIVKQHLITGRKDTSGLFLTGLLPRVLKYSEKKGYKITVLDPDEAEKEIIKRPKLKGITFRPDQRKALRAVKKNKRGKIIFPTGSGKTIIALGIMSMFPEYRILFLCHTKDLIEQTKEELVKFGFKNFQIIGAGYKVQSTKKLFNKDSVIVLSTIQSFSNLSTKKYSSFFDITIVDEVHHVNSTKSQYGQVMSNNLSPRRYGLTATEPTKEHEKLINEGFFGPTIAELSLEEGIEKGIIAEPVVDLVPVPYEVKINQACQNRYAKFYDLGIVNNKARNRLIVERAIDSIEKDKIVLIIIERTEHGKVLKKMLKYNGVLAPFIHGSTDRTVRVKTRNKLKAKKIKIAICSKVWKEGINIPSLDHIINAVGFKEEKAVMQAIGRGLRTAEGKDTIKLTDFLDPYRYLAEHSVLRIQVYVKNNWL